MGLVSVEAEHFFRSEGWEEHYYYTGNAMRPDMEDPADSSFLLYKIRIPAPGVYRFHLLGNQIRSEEEIKSGIRCTLYDHRHRVIQSADCPVPGLYAPRWTGLNKETIEFKVERADSYLFRIEAATGRSFSIDKFVFSSIDGFSPSGTGPRETLTGESLPVKDPRIILPPSWAFGVLYGGYTDQEQTLDAIDSLLLDDFPVDAYWLDSYFWDFNRGRGPGGYIDFTGDTTAYPDPGQLWSNLGDRGIKAGLWIWDQINESGNEAVFRDFQERGFFKNVYRNRNGWHNEPRDTRTGVIDFENEDAVAYWKKRLEPFFEDGLDFLKLDNSSGIPFCRAAFTAEQEMGRETGGRGFIIAHLMSISDDRMKLYPTRWTGDSRICWSQPDYPNLRIYAMGGYKENIGMVADPGLTTYEVPFLTHDAGGYDYFGSEEQSNELYTRWIQFASMDNIMSMFSTASNPTRNHPYRYPEPVRENFRKYSHLRMRLFPYLYSAAMQSRLTGTKMIRGDGVHEFQYTLGDDLLVAPVFESGSRQRTLYLPDGEWIDFETDEEYKGGRTITVDAPLDKLPLFVRAGSVLPMRNYARSIESGSNDTLSLHVYPSEKPSQYILYEDDGTSNDYLEDVYSATTFSVRKSGSEITFEVSPVKGTYKGMGNVRYYRLQFHLSGRPGEVYLDGKRMPSGWVFDGNTARLSLSCMCVKENGFRVRIVY